VDTDKFVECWVVNARRSNITTVDHEIAIVVVASCWIGVVKAVMI